MKPNRRQNTLPPSSGLPPTPSCIRLSPTSYQLCFITVSNQEIASHPIHPTASCVLRPTWSVFSEMSPLGKCRCLPSNYRHWRYLGERRCRFWTGRSAGAVRRHCHIRVFSDTLRSLEQVQPTFLFAVDAVVYSKPLFQLFYSHALF